MATAVQERPAPAHKGVQRAEADGECREKGEGGVEVGEDGDYYTHHCYTVTTRMTLVLRWAAMKAILMIH